MLEFGLALLSISAFFITWMANNIHEIQKNKTGQKITGRAFVIVTFMFIAIMGIGAIFTDVSYDKTWQLLLCMFLTVAFSVVTGFCLSKWLFYKDSNDSKEKEDAKKYIRYGFGPGLFLSILCFILSLHFMGEAKNMYFK